MLRLLGILLVAAAVAGGLWGLTWAPADAASASGPDRTPPAVAVEVGSAGRGPLVARRTYSGTLEPAAEVTVASKVSGRVERLEVDLGDRITRGQIVARIDDDEFVQAVGEAEADVEVALAEASEAESALALAERRLERAESLTGGGIASEATLDDARAEVTAASARVRVTAARVKRARATLEATRVRLGYTVVAADWTGGDDERVVGARLVDEGTTLGANAALLSIVELDPVLAVVFVPERDFAGIGLGQRVTLSVDAYEGETFTGRVERIAPVFANATRQARIELVVQNPDERLRPGMFARATIEIDRVEDALHVPVSALYERDGRTGLFEVSPDRTTVSWRAVRAGVVDGDRAQLLDLESVGEVVILGQALLEDGGRVRVFEPESAPGAGEPVADRS